MRSAVVLAVIVCVLLCAVVFGDDYEPGLQDLDGHEWGVVVNQDVVLFGIPVSAGGLTPAERATIIADQRLDPLSNAGVLDKPENFRVGKMGSEVVIAVDNPGNAGGLGSQVLLLTIDRNFSKFLGRNRYDIAYYWRDLMRKWSSVAAQGGTGMKSLDGVKAPGGKSLDPKHSWHQIPAGYRHKAKKD